MDEWIILSLISLSFRSLGIECLPAARLRWEEVEGVVYLLSTSHMYMFMCVGWVITLQSLKCLAPPSLNEFDIHQRVVVHFQPRK